MQVDIRVTALFVYNEKRCSCFDIEKWHLFQNKSTVTSFWLNFKVLAVECALPFVIIVHRFLTIPMLLKKGVWINKLIYLSNK